MGKLKVPSLQHMARLWQPESAKVTKALLALVKGGPTFTYDPLFSLVRDLLLFNIPYGQIREGLSRISRSDVRENFLELFELVGGHFDGVTANFVQGVAPRYYSVGRGLMVPFNPPLIYGAGGEIHFPWFSFWRSHPLGGERLSLFVTIVEEILLQDPDLEGAKFSILDFSAPKPGEPRQLEVVDVARIERVSASRLKEMLEVFAEGYRNAEAVIATTDRTREAEEAKRVDPAQLRLIS